MTSYITRNSNGDATGYGHSRSEQSSRLSLRPLRGADLRHLLHFPSQTQSAQVNALKNLFCVTPLANSTSRFSIFQGTQPANNNSNDYLRTGSGRLRFWELKDFNLGVSIRN
ncbi:unnamed protein product [Fraxinus pennsylvanica]|uniref:Uncharacterized protein n=1 Tax=Fraxinus pennsylvanica TaxID=56036 RepID=A0AAD2DZX3_9LAMI|nr:unnamed protein product [Fraxinus pennsylvanica]